MGVCASGAVGLALLLGGCRESAAVPALEPRAVEIEVVRLEPEAPSLVVSGVVAARARISLAFRVAGFVERFHVDEGERVEKGTVLAELDTEDLERELRTAVASHERALARAEEAQQEFDRQRQLWESQITSQAVHEKARLAYQMAQAESREARIRVETAEDALAKAVLRAPVTGYIERRLLEEHEVASAQIPVLVLDEIDPVVVRAAVPDTSLHRLQIGGEVLIRTPLWPGRTFVGEIRRIDVAADTLTRTVPFEVELPNPDLALRPELVLEVEIEPQGESVYALPLAAILRDIDPQPFCFVAMAEGELTQVERRPLTLGPMRGDRVTVTAGIKAGDRVVVRGQNFLRPGDPVRVIGD